jgi:2-methylcitrate dehydratase PrpD
MNETITMAQYLADLQHASIPQDILDEMKILLFDYLGVALGGSRTQSGKIVAEFSKAFEEKQEATIIGFGYRVSAPNAAFSNAILSHSIELDDVDSLAYFHFSPPIFSAALAAAERQHSSGRDFIVALVAGCDLMARLSAAMNPSLRDRGYHTTPTCGVFGAAAASGKLLGLGPEEMTSALGLAGAQASGLMEMYGVSMQKRFNPGPAARSGVVSAILAQMGFTGAETILEGERGFLKAFSDRFDLMKLVEGLGKDFPIYIEYKPYACARPIHNAIDCALEIKRQQSIDPAQVASITVYRHPRWANYHQIKKPRTYHEAQVSLPYAVAVSLLEGKAFLEQYSDEKLKDPIVQNLSQRVEIKTVEGLPRDVSCRLEVVLISGESLTSQVDYPRGSIQNPMSDSERWDKFQQLSAGILDEEKQKRVQEMVFKIDAAKDVSELLTLLIGKE